MEESTDKIFCYSCKKLLEHQTGEKVFRNEECPFCQASLRCCKMCKHFDMTAYNECQEPVAERLLEKERANFCEFFSMAGEQNSGPEKNILLNAANSLFKK